MAGSVIDAVGLGQAAGAQKAGIRRGGRELKKALGRVEDMFSPFSEAGLRSLENFEATANLSPQEMVAGIEDDPFYQFQLKQGLGAVEGSAAAAGNLRSGATLKDLTEFSQGLASSQVDKAFQRRQQQQNELLQLINTGFSASSNVANANLGTAQGLSNLQLALGDVKAQERAGFANLGKGLLSSAGASFGGGGGGLAQFLSGGAF